MKRYECSRYGDKWGVFDTLTNNRLVATFADWIGGATYEDHMNHQHAAMLEIDENMGDECWMLTKQA